MNTDKSSANVDEQDSTANNNSLPSITTKKKNVSMTNENSSTGDHSELKS